MPSVTPRSSRGRRRSNSNANRPDGSATTYNGESSKQTLQQNGNKRVIKLRTRSSQRGGDTSMSEKQEVGKDDDEEHANENEEEKIQEEKKLYERWAEEYFEIVEQLPLELHRTFALMRELESKVQVKTKFLADHTITYRDARLSAKSEVPVEASQANGIHDKEVVEAEVEGSVQYDYGSSSDRDAEGEEVDEVYHEAEPITAVATNIDESDKQDDQEVLSPSPPATSSLVITTPRAARESLLEAIARASGEAIRAAEEKVGLAVTAYDWVDRHIRRLDADLQRSESSLLLGLRAGTEASRVVRDALGAGETDASFSRTNLTSIQDESMMDGEKTISQGDSRTRRSDSRRKKTSADEESNEADLSTTLLTDMAIDPNEPKYCYCDEVSSGDMVACDNEDCPREWFHYHCVGLTSPPKGRWYCLFCTPSGFKGSGTFPAGAPCLPPGYGSKRKYNTNGHQGNHKKKKKKY